LGPTKGTLPEAAVRSLEQGDLTRWFDLDLTAPTLEAFRGGAQAGPPPSPAN
jgi:hypothetical protein